jgi:MFS family permease
MSDSKAYFYILELINCYAAVFYSNFLFFYMRNRFGFGEMQNLLLAALNGLIYIFAARKGGAFAQKFGAIRSIYIGLAGFACAMTAGLLLHNNIPAQILVFALWSISVCFIWPAIEGIVCEGCRNKLSDMVGYYNIVWAIGSAVSYFSAGMLLEHFGMQSLFWIPLSLVCVAIVSLTIITLLRKKQVVVPYSADKAVIANELTTASKKQFMYMAWLANPLAYVAINTVLPLAPSISERIGLSTGTAGIVCSAWMFARLATFIVLRRWDGWHYKFKLLAGSLIVLPVCFTLLVFAKSVPLVLVAQTGFGIAIGLAYYSSLYYSMNASKNLESHGGLHESMIGVGQLLGPVLGAGSLLFLPSSSLAGVWSVSGLLTIGFGALLYMRRSGKKQNIINHEPE